MEENIPELTKEITKSDVEFKSYGILTFWLLPLIGIILITGAGGLYVLMTIAVLLYTFIKNKPVPGLSKFLYNFGRLTYGAKFEHKDYRAIRVSWMFLIGLPLSALIVFLLAVSSIYIIPLLIILRYRKDVLRFLFILTFLPSRKFMYYDSFEYRKQKENKLAQFNESEKEYMIFLKPSKFTHLFAILGIIFLPLFLATFLIPIDIGFQLLSQEDFTVNPDIIGLVSVIGLIAVIPYMILFGPLPKKYRLTRVVVSRVAGKMLQLITGSGFSNTPLFDGDYFIERKSLLSDMSTPFGIVEIFRRGRLMTIILLPLALISLVFRFIITEILDLDGIQQTTSKDIGETIQESIIQNPVTLFSLMFIVPLVLSLLLPIIFVLSDAEIKRSQWKSSGIEGVDSEISGVEDVGKTLNNLIKIILGVGTITSLTSSLQILLPFADSSTAYLITGLLLVFGAILIFPGTLFLVYSYFASGDHVYGVNYLRILASESEYIGVGTIDKDFTSQSKLSQPPQYILDGLAKEISST